MSVSVPRDIMDLTDSIDIFVLQQIRKEPSGLVPALYNYLDPDDRPISPREFLEFWENLTLPERIEALNPNNRHNGYAPWPDDKKTRLLIFEVAAGWCESGLAWWEMEID
jgi:hypothetical protein